MELAQLPEAVPATASSNFEPSPAFHGPRPGWAFKRGPEGLGYYRDVVPKIPHRIFWLLKEGCCTEALALAADDPALWHEVDADGNTPLHWGSLIGNLRLVRAALAAGVPVDARGNNGQSPLMWATSAGQVHIATALLEAAADPCAEDSMGYSPAIIAVQHQRATMLLLFFAKAPRAKVMAHVDGKGCSLLHWAAYMGDSAALKILDHFGADFRGAVDGEGKTPLHRAICREPVAEEVLDFLLVKGVDPTHKDAQGVTCMEAAINAHKKAAEKIFAKLLRAHSLSASADAASSADLCNAEAGLVKQRAAAAATAQSLAEQGDLQKMMRYGPAVFWLACVSLTVFEYLIEMRTFSWTLCPLGALAFEFGIPASLFLFLYVATSDPGKVAPRPQSVAIEELVQAFESGKLDTAPRLCSATWVIKGPRAKYCKFTGRCVEEFDHFCGWLNTAIGRDNHRPFILLTAMEVFTQLCFIYLSLNVASQLVPWKGKLLQWGLNALAGYPLLALVSSVQMLTAFYILNLLRYQLVMVAMNYTTNEYVNALRYGYAEVVNGRVIMKHNPFDKGGPMPNCMDFWWFRRRSDRGPSPEDEA